MSDVYTLEFDPESGKPLRKVRSFVLREGRLTKGQERALEELWPRFGVEYRAQVADPAVLFGREAPLVLEIGYGMGASLLAMAQAEPATNFLGIEVHTPGVGALLMGVEEKGLTNLHTLHHDAVEVLQHMIPDASLDRVQLYFPDPWHKKRHHKRRIVQPEFVALLVRKLKPGGLLHFATDWQNYAEWMLDVLRAEPALTNLSPAGDYVEQPAWRPHTKFEARGERLGHGVWDLLFRR
jgi:tRNA (guanine-N7-)-methyltransferase